MDRIDYCISSYNNLSVEDKNTLNLWIHFNIKPIRYINKKLSISELYSGIKENINKDVVVDIDILIGCLIENGYKYYINAIGDIYFNISSSSKCVIREEK